MSEQAIHFAHDADADLLTLPLLALHQRAAAVLAQDQVDAAVWAAQASFFGNPPTSSGRQKWS
ncbi:hypothetical protein AC610_22360 [Xanthomonas phaseoli pv. phaseoli]|nr:hypothetical protein AC610_22360 [Xanthomonas phaseoli pv. phaseoli]